MKFGLLSLIGGALVMSACGKDNPLRETSLGITSATSVARVMQLALDAVTGIPVASCVQVSQACTDRPCDGGATISIGDECPLPLGTGDTGMVTVSGRFDSSSRATLGAQFIDVTTTGTEQPEAIALASVTQVTAERSGNTVEVKYAGQNAAARADVGAASVGAASTWTVTIDTQGTPELSDDVLVVESTAASGAAGLGASVKAASLDNVRVDPSCRLNPIAGEGSITEVSGFIPSITKIRFDGTCDGTGRVNGDPHPFVTTP